jgi:hypothetical protein
MATLPPPPAPQIGATPPAAQPTYVVVASPPGKGFAVTALVCGIVGAVFGLVPLTFVIAFAGGIVALVFGLLGAHRNKAVGAPAGMARAGWILGVVAIALGILGASIMNQVSNDLDRIQDDLNHITIPD